MAHSKSQNACLVCGKELIYHEESVEMECIYCHKKFMSNATMYVIPAILKKGLKP